MPSPTPLLLSLLAFLSSAQAFFILDQSPLVRTRLDPIVSPGSVSGHVHSVSGGSRFSQNYDHDDMQKSKCTTAPVTVDKSAYWAPQLYYINPVGPTYQAIPNYARTYYLQRPGNKNEKIMAFPKGLRMIAGNPNRRTYDGSSFADQAVSFVCLDYYNSHSGDPNWEQRNNFFPQNCPDGMRAQVFFPSCWNGVDLDSADHKSHMAYPIDNFQGGNCPSTHPIHLVSLFYEWIFSVGDFPFNKDGPTWAFANGDTTGYGFHADFTNGWDIDILQSALDTCGLETNGVVDNCAALQPYIDHQAASACQPEMPVVNEDIGFGHAISKLPGNNPIWIGNSTKPNDPTYSESANYTSPSSTLPDGWTEVGCIPEPTNARALLAASFTSQDMTVGSCVNYCASLGLPLAGVEYGTQCYCDSKLRNGATSTGTVSSDQCSVKCSGLNTENCGGASKLTLFVNPDYASTAPILPSGWVYSSCMTEASSGRALSGGTTSSDSMSVETCVNFCNDAGFAYAGLEYGRECWCSNTVGAGAGTAAETQCAMSCSGNIRQTCGGSSRLSVYYNSNAMATNTSSSSTSASSSASTSSISSRASSSSSIASSSVSSRASSSSAITSSSLSSVASSSSARPSSSVSSASSSSASTSSRASTLSLIKTLLPILPVRRSSSISSSLRSLSIRSTLSLRPTSSRSSSSAVRSSSSTVKSTTVRSSSARSSATTVSSSSAVSSPSSSVKPSSSSVASSSSIVLSSTVISSSSVSSTKTLSSSAAASSTATAVVLAGDYAAWATPCVKQTNPKIFTTLQVSNSSMTPLMCTQLCSDNGLAWASLEYASECRCGSKVDTTSLVASTACTMTCAGDNTLKSGCGGSSAISVYYSPAVNSAAQLVLPSGWAVNTNGPGACASEISNGRTLAAYTFSSNTMTVPTCLSACAARGYIYGGLEYATQCWCGGFIAPASVAVQKCTSPCKGALSQICGGSSALSIYKYTAPARRRLQ